MWHITVLVGLLLATLGTANESNLMLSLTDITCSSITVNWTPPVNTTSMIHYSSSVHNETVNYSIQQNSQQPQTETVHGLVAGIKYTITVTVHYMDGKKLESSQTTRTMNGTAVQDFHITVQSFTTSLRINLTGPNVSKHYYSCWLDSTEHGLLEWQQSRTITVDGLHPGTAYMITCQEMSNNCPTAHTVVTTRSTLMLNIKQKKCSSIKVRWTPPVNTTSMIHYSSSVHNGTVNYSMQQNSQQPQTETVHGLVADIKYTITVTVHYMDATEEREHKNTRTKSGTAVQDFHITVQSFTTSLRINLTGPNVSKHSYSCWLNSTEHGLLKWQQTRPITVDGLHPGTAYMITCQEMSNDCPTAHTVVTTTPSAPANVSIINVTCNSATVMWSPAQRKDGESITKYRVVVYKGSTPVLNESAPVEDAQRAFHLDELELGIMYTVEVAASNVAGFGRSTNTSFTTSHTESVGINVTDIKSTRVWYTINGQQGSLYTCTVGNTSVNTTAGAQMSTPGLDPNTNYTIKCTATEQSCLTVEKTIRTVQAPSTVSGLQASGPVSVVKGKALQNITWTASTSGKVLYYFVRYELQGNNATSRTANTTSTSTLLSLSLGAQLQPMVTYIVQVAIVTPSNEQGNFSELEVNYSIPGVPQSVEVTSLSCEAVRVTWKPPKSNGGLVITGYQLSHNGMELDREFVTKPPLATEIHGLQPNTDHTVKVAAKNALGTGKSAMNNTTTDMRNEDQNIFSATPLTSTVIMVGVLQGVSERGYQVCVASPSNNGRARHFNLTETTTKVTDFDPDTTYMIKCVTYSHDGNDACYESVENVTTKEGGPARVTNVRKNGSTWVERRKIYQPIAWDMPPTAEHDVPESYVVTYRNVQWAVRRSNESRNTTALTLILVMDLTEDNTEIIYKVWVSAKSSTGEGPLSKVLTLQYKEPDTAPAGLAVEAKSCHVLNVTWTPPTRTGNLPIAGYKLEYIDSRTNKRNVHNTSTPELLKQLNPGTTYSVRVKVVNAIGEGMFTRAVQAMTQPRALGSVTAIPSTHSIALHRNLGTKMYYLCNLTDAKSLPLSPVEVNKNVTTQPTTVTRLLPNTTYSVDCVAYSSDGVEACLEANTTVNTFSDKVLSVMHNEQGMVMKFNATVATIRQVITWTAPPNFRNITHYLVKYGKADEINGPSDVNIMTERTEMNLTRTVLLIQMPRKQTPTYSVSYSVWVAAVSDQHQGTFSDRHTFTYAKPNSPTRLKAANPTCNSITLTWSAPSYTGGVPLEEYAVRWRGRGSPLMTDGPDVTAVTITHLSPKTSYTIDVSAVNAIGERSKQISAVTVLQDKPLELSVSTISSTSLQITAQPPPGLEMVEVNCTLTSKDNSSYNRSVSLDNTRDGGSQRLADNLVPYTNYTATCLVFKDGVDQCYIGRDTTQTYTDIPSGPPEELNPVSTSSHSFTMTWAPPPKGEQNGEIVSYEVEYREEGSNSTVVNTTQGMRYTAEDLTTDRVYQFRVAANTVNGTGPFSEWDNVTTIPTVTNLKAVNTTTSSATITWDQPPHNYRVFLQGEATDKIPQSRVIPLVDVTGQTTHIVKGLNSFRKYSISVYLESDLGQGSNATVTFQTLRRAPDGSPTHLRATPTRRSVTLQWSPPPVLSRNGILTHYVVGLANETWNTTQSHSITGEQRKRREADSEGVGEETQSLTVGHLRPFTNYTWEVAAVSGFGAGPPSDGRRFETHQDVPAQVESIHVNFTQKTITWAAPVEPNGIIVSYRVQYWELGRRDTTEEVNTTQDQMISYSHFRAGVPHKVQVQAATVAGLGESRVVEEVLFSEEQAPTVSVLDITVTRVNDTAVRVTWTKLTLNDARGFPTYVVNITKDGEQVSSQRTPSTSVVVGGLMPHTQYNVTVQSLTAGGTKGGPHSAPVTIEALPEPTDGSSSPLTWILVVLIVVLIVAVVIFTVVVVVICRRYRSKNKTKPAGLWKDIPMKERGVLQEGMHAPLDLGPITDPEDRIQRKEAVLKENFCEHVQKLHQDKNALFVAEYQSITQTPEGVRDSAFKANVIKNRYVNIFPYDHSRVVLKERDSTGSDYINGAYIDAYNRANGYIATQGPTPDTLADFWQMVWEHHAPVIVMLTKLIEKNKRKCEQYWATELNEPFKPGRDLSVTILRCDTHPEFELRTIKVEKLSSKEDPLVVKHFLYTAWPDHGVPQYSVSIHRFIRQHVRPVYNDSSAPLIVHCSAGAGRTGTYMAIDTMMYQLEDRQNANIFEYVERMRTRRTQMVQNASQYIYIHDAINDYINCKDTTIVAHELRPRIEEMRQIDITTGSSGFVTQFSLLAEVSIRQCDADYAFAEEEDIMSKNRYRGLCPFSDKHLTKEDDSYINASEISGYCGQRNFIAAQTPMKNTEGDVWEMIWMEKCAAVVVLCKFVEENDEMCSKFWPLKMSEPKTFGSIKVCLDDKVEQASYNEYHLTVSFTNHPDPLKVVVFHYLQWPRHGRPSIPPYLQLMGEVERSQHNATGPTLVMCDDGMSRTGVFITTMAEVERVKVQGEVDIFQTVKAARSERPYMVSTPVDYEVCHDVLVSYLESFDTYANFK